jgi:hypothetical protein
MLSWKSEKSSFVIYEIYMLTINDKSSWITRRLSKLIINKSIEDCSNESEFCVNCC